MAAKKKIRKKTTKKTTGKTTARKTITTRKTKEPTIFGIPQTPALLALIVIAFGGGILLSGNMPGGGQTTSTTGQGVAVTTITQAGGGTAGRYGQVKLDFYVMSQCPYGTQVVDAIAPVLKKLGDAVDFNLEFIATDMGGGQFQALHGQPEVEGNIIQLCAAKYEPSKYMDMIVCMNKNARAIPGNWEQCASSSGLNVGTLKSCYEGDEGKQLLSVSSKKAEAVNARGSPTMFLNDQPYQGGRDSLAFQRALCTQLQGHPECAGMPACALDTDCTGQPGKIGSCQNPGAQNAKCTYTNPVKLNAIIVNDAKCGTACDTSRLKQVLQQMFLGASFREVDVSSAEGAKLVKDLGITVAPAYLFERAITSTNTWKTNTRIQGAFEQKGSYYKITDEASGASWFVSEEARQAYKDAIGLSPGDNKPQIDFFVMSYCPYGNQAEEIVSDVYDILGDKVEYIPHYVIYENYGGGGPDYCLDDESKYCSLHGIQELNQNIREVCVYNDLGIGKYFEFVKAMNTKCSSSNADTCWTAVAAGLGLDTAAIAKCEKEKGLEITKKDRDLNVILKVRGSPTIYIEGEQYAGSRSVAGFANALCAKFDAKPSECSNLPAETAAAPAASGSC